MKLTFIFPALSALVLTACSGSFSQQDFQPEIYQGYWAMMPVNGDHNVVKFSPNGTVNVYHYSCYGGNNYRLDETDTYGLVKVKANFFHLVDKSKKPFAYFEVVSVNRHTLIAKQHFLDPQVNPKTIRLHYRNSVGSKPIC